MSYIPCPLTTAHVQLPKSLEDLREILAENVHELWAKQRISEGWSYGVLRDDIKKHNPCLVPYSQLPESEKEYDRITATETLKAIVVSGYTIATPNEVSTVSIQMAAECRKKLQYAKGGDIHSLWKDRLALGMQLDRSLYTAFVKRASSVGDFLLAIDMAQEALEKYPEDIFFKQRLALCMAQTGASSEARSILQGLVDSGSNHQETLSLLGRTWKDDWISATDRTHQDNCLRSAYLCYAQAYLGLDAGKRSLDLGARSLLKLQPVGDYYPGINAASLALLLGKKQLSRAFAAKVKLECEKALGELNKVVEDETSYWIIASLAEAEILLGNEEAARRLFRQACTAQGVSRREMLSSTRRQARFLAKRLLGKESFFDDCFPEQTLVVFAGHIIDKTDSPFIRFPSERIDWVGKAISERLEGIKAGVGFSSAAGGSDLLFIEAMGKRGGDTYIYLPWPQEVFRKTSVINYAGRNWGKCFDKGLQQAANVVEVANYYMPGDNDDLGSAYCSDIMIGLAKLKARQLDLKIIPMVVWDGTTDWAGGTGAFANYWKDQNIPIQHIKLARRKIILSYRKIVANDAKVNAEQLAPRRFAISKGSRIVRAMLFADIKGYSKLSETEIYYFFSNFLRSVSQLMASSPHAPICNNTWGDAFYFVFNGVREAGIFALELIDLIIRTDWSLQKLPKDLNIRIGLHAGPVFASFDPVTRQITFNGSHVSTTARLEPVTEKGKVFATQEFAALAAFENVTEFRCIYVGQRAFAKKFGMRPVYMVKTESRPQEK